METIVTEVHNDFVGNGNLWGYESKHTSFSERGHRLYLWFHFMLKNVSRKALSCALLHNQASKWSHSSSAVHSSECWPQSRASYLLPSQSHKTSAAFFFLLNCKIINKAIPSMFGIVKGFTSCLTTQTIIQWTLVNLICQMNCIYVMVVPFWVLSFFFIILRSYILGSSRFMFYELTFRQAVSLPTLLVSWATSCTTLEKLLNVP